MKGLTQLLRMEVSGLRQVQTCLIIQGWKDTDVAAGERLSATNTLGDTRKEFKEKKICL